MVIIDGQSYDLSKTALLDLRPKILTCKDLKIQRGKGRLGYAYTNFLQMLRKCRKDLYDLGDELFVVKSKADASGNANQANLEQQLSGSWLTLAGMYE